MLVPYRPDKSIWCVLGNLVCFSSLFLVRKIDFFNWEAYRGPASQVPFWPGGRAGV